MKLGLLFAVLILLSSNSFSLNCDPINTLCQETSIRVCELKEDVIDRVAREICYLAPDPVWYDPGRLKKKCRREFTNVLIPGTSTCSSALGFSCPSTTGLSSSCADAMNIVKSCMSGNISECNRVVGNAALREAFGPLCQTAHLYGINLLENSYETQLHDIVDDGLYNNIKYIFGTLLGDTNFDDYVRGTVKHYKAPNSAFTLTGLNPDEGEVGRAYLGKAFYNTTTPSNELIIHELTHIWQIRNSGVKDFTGKACGDEITHKGDHDKKYEFVIESGKKFADYGIEQQAEIIEVYYAYKTNSQSGCYNSYFKNCSEYSSDSQREAALRDLIGGRSSSGSSSSSSSGGFTTGMTCEERCNATISDPYGRYSCVQGCR